MRIRGVLLLLAAVGLLTAGCGVQGLNFLIDKRVTIVEPADREERTLPVTVRWEVTDFEVTGPDGSQQPDAGYFGVFVNRAPQPPGEPLEWFARDDDSCVPSRGCPDEEYLETRRVHTTTETSYTFEHLPRPSGDRREFHEVTIVLLDGTGRRIGESAFAVQFQIERESQ